MKFNRNQIQMCGGRHPMCGQNSAPVKVTRPPSSFVGLKEADVLTRWVALCVGFVETPNVVSRDDVAAAIRNIFLWRITHIDAVSPAIVAQFFHA